eukprot:1158366-Pelagomonas_calceolata.AAC.1
MQAASLSVTEQKGCYSGLQAFFSFGDHVLRQFTSTSRRYRQPHGQSAHFVPLCEHSLSSRGHDKRPFILLPYLCLHSKR